MPYLPFNSLSAFLKASILTFMVVLHCFHCFTVSFDLKTNKSCCLQDKDFGKNGLARAHMNPPAQLATTLKTFQKYTLLKAYTGETFFWGLAPGVDDVVDFKFHPAIFVER